MSILTPDEIQECMTAAHKVMGEGRDLEGCFAAEIEAALLKKLSTSKIKTWRERYGADQPRNQDRLMQAEVDDLRVALAYAQEDCDLALSTIESRDRNIATLLEVNKELQAQLTELNLQYISDFGQLQEREPILTG